MASRLGSAGRCGASAAACRSNSVALSLSSLANFVKVALSASTALSLRRAAFSKRVAGFFMRYHYQKCRPEGTWLRYLPFFVGFAGGFATAFRRASQRFSSSSGFSRGPSGCERRAQGHRVETAAGGSAITSLYVRQIN